MNFKHYLYIVIYILILWNPVTAQNTDLAIGQWDSFLPFNASQSVTQSETDVFYSTGQGLLRVAKDGSEIERITKIEGLSGVGLRILGYNNDAETLIVVYNSGVIDLVGADEIVTLLNIAESQIITGAKIVYDIEPVDANTTYLAGNFGISNLNVTTGKFLSTTKTPLPIFSVAVYDGFIYAGTEEGIYAGNLNSGINLGDFNNWQYLGAAEGFREIYTARHLAAFNDKLYLEVNDSIFGFDGNSISFLHENEGTPVEYISAEGDNLIVGYRRQNNMGADAIFAFDADLNIRQSPNECLGGLRYGVEDQNGILHMADVFNGYRRWDIEAGTCNRFDVNSPFSSKVSDILVDGDDLWIASGGIDLTNNDGTDTNDGFFGRIDGTWNTYNKFNVFPGGTFDDWHTLARHPQNGRIYAGSFNKGIAVVEEGELIEVLDADNTNGGLNVDVGSTGATRIGGLAFDEDNNLWVTNPRSNTPLAVLQNDGTWKNFTFDCNVSNSLKNVVIDNFGRKWMLVLSSSFGLIVFDEGDLADDTDDECRVITSSNSNLPTNQVRDMAVDLDGNVWVGTEQGVIVFECDGLSSDCDGSLRVVEVDNFGGNLLEEEDVRAVAVDGANRKWFGTTNGIFVQSPSGEEEVLRFTEDNSPLFSNDVQKITFRGATGEVFIGTSEGVQVYRSDATTGGSIHDSEVVVFPNPVRPDYLGPIAIKGLAQDANVKITDVSGRLIFETTALGGQAIWDGRDYNGRRANTGVYVVFSTNDNVNDPNTAVAKILFVN